MDLYAVMQYLMTAACCAAALAVVVPLADRPQPGRRGSIGDPPILARICAILALLCGISAFAIGVRLFGLGEVLITVRLQGPMFLMVGAGVVGPLLLLGYSQRLEEQRERSRRRLEDAANQAVESYRYDAHQLKTPLLPFAAIVGGGSLYYATLLWENVKQSGPEGPLMTKLEYVAASLLFIVVCSACCKLAYSLLFRLPSVVKSSGFFITGEALIERAGGLGGDQWVPWESVESIQPPTYPSEPYRIRHRKGILRVASSVLEREALIAAILERSPNLEASPRQFLPRLLPETDHRVRDPLLRFVFVAVPFLIALSLEWHSSPWSVRALPGPARVAIAAVPFIILLLSGRGPTQKGQRVPWFVNTLALVVTMYLCQIIEHVIRGG